MIDDGADVGNLVVENGHLIVEQREKIDTVYLIGDQRRFHGQPRLGQHHVFIQPRRLEALLLVGDFLPKSRVHLVLKSASHTRGLIPHRDRLQHTGFQFLFAPNRQVDCDREADHVLTSLAHGCPVALAIRKLDIEVGEIFFPRKFDRAVVARDGALQGQQLRA